MCPLTPGGVGVSSFPLEARGSIPLPFTPSNGGTGVPAWRDWQEASRRGTGSNERKGSAMARCTPFRSKLPGTRVHHNNTSCQEGNNIESYNRISGTGGLPLCSRCASL